MANYIVPGEQLTAIANAIRTKTNITTPIKVIDMPTKIQAITTEGSSEGDSSTGEICTITIPGYEYASDFIPSNSILLYQDADDYLYKSTLLLPLIENGGGVLRVPNNSVIIDTGANIGPSLVYYSNMNEIFYQSPISVHLVLGNVTFSFADDIPM